MTNRFGATPIFHGKESLSLFCASCVSCPCIQSAKVYGSLLPRCIGCECAQIVNLGALNESGNSQIVDVGEKGK